jgi:hypothetical protein
MMMDVDQAAKAMKEAEIEAEIEDSSKASISPPTARHVGQWGPGGYVVEPAWLEWDVELTRVTSS